MSAETSELVQRTKRRGTALSCAECRRLKLKCSRVFPCNNCTKKGCGAICPEGTLTTGKGNRFVLANTESLHDKITELATRVRQLEDALQEAHSLNSTSRHPLLAEELLQIKNPLQRERMNSRPAPSTGEQDVVDELAAVGSLSLSEDGKANFFGLSASAWYLLKNEDDEREIFPGNAPQRNLEPTDVSWLSHAFPFASTSEETRNSLRGLLLQMVPPQEEARRLSIIYCHHAAWMYHPINMDDFDETVLTPIYRPSNDAPISGHVIALLFMVLAIGVHVDLDHPAGSPEPMQYYHLGRAALALDSVFEEQTITGIQALVVMIHFMFLKGIESPRWVAMGIVVKLAQSIGLHRDSNLWKLDEKEGLRRRKLMWEIYVYDSWQSLTFGRPPSLSTQHIDTTFPFEQTTNEKGQVEMTFDCWKHRWTSQYLSLLHEKAFSAKMASYQAIQAIDRHMRLAYIPPSLQVPGFGGAKNGYVDNGPPSASLTMQRYTAYSIREISLFYVHRGFFAKALEENSSDPMGSKYAASVLAVYSSACSFVGLIESLYAQHRELSERLWFLFTHVFSCGVVLGSIAMRPRMAIAPSALSHLESAHNLFSQITDVARASKMLNVLGKLLSRARASLYAHQHPTSAVSSPDERDEFAPLGGGTRLVSRRGGSSPSSSGNGRDSQSPGLQSVSPPTASNVPPLSSSSGPSPDTASEPYSHVDFPSTGANRVPEWNPSNSHYSNSYMRPQGFSNIYEQFAQELQTQSFVPVNQLEMSSMYEGTAYSMANPPAMQYGNNSSEMYRTDGGQPFDATMSDMVPNAELNASWQSFFAPYRS